MRSAPRRTFLIWLITGSIAALVAALSGIFALFVWPKAKTRGVVIRLPKALADIEDGEVFHIVAPPPGASFEMADGGGNNHAGDPTASAWVVRSCGSLSVLAADCSHLGCAVNFRASDQKFACPCHGSTYGVLCQSGRSEFSVDGAVSHGPAGFPLAHIRWQKGPQADTIELLPRKG